MKENMECDEISINLIEILKERFEKNMIRHKNILWKDVEKKLYLNDAKYKILNRMESTGGEPDVVNYNKKNDEYTFVDC